MKEQKKNSMKQMAVELAHIMDDSQRYEEMTDCQQEEHRATQREINSQILENGYNINTLLYLAQEYKTLSIEEYFQWIYK